MNNKNWFQYWFNSKYYHILYQDRNDDEAQLFMCNLTSFLKLKIDSKILDLPCGKGRHSVFLNSLGYNVIGADLSENSINHAKQYENDTLKFVVHDMRNPLKSKYNAIFNLFTSFGYFDDDLTNIEVLKNLKNGLKKEGVLIIDFLNTEYVKEYLVKEEVQVKSNIEFKIKRSINTDFIVKDIHFKVDGKPYHFTEYVRNINIKTFKNYIESAGLKLKHIFGDYNLNEFDLEKSPRLILVLE